MEVIFIHGYSDSWTRIKNNLGEKLLNFNKSLSINTKIENLNFHYISYKSLEDSATFEDLVEGLYEKLKQNRTVRNLLDDKSSEKVSFIVHSTGALIVRQLLKQYNWLNIKSKIDKIIFLAPANFGSPLAHKGKTILGKLARGNQSVGEDFLEVGKLILNDLELASLKQWEIANFDLFGETEIYGFGKILPFVITGTKPYEGIRKYISEEGTDGTIVVAGTSLNARKYLIDFTQKNKTVEWSKRNNKSIHPALFLNSYDHSTIIDKTDEHILNYIIKFLNIQNENDYINFNNLVDITNSSNTHQSYYQQLYFSIKDDRDTPIIDYHLEFNVIKISDCKINKVTKKVTHIRDKEVTNNINKYLNNDELVLSDKIDKILKSNAHTNSQNPHLRRFLINPTLIKKLIGNTYLITMNIDAETNEDEIFYNDAETKDIVVLNPQTSPNISFFYENTTTFIEIKMDRFSNLVQRYSPENGYKGI